MTAPLPAGFAVSFDPGNVQLNEDAIFGGSPPRVLRLTPSGTKAMTELLAGPARSLAARVLARRFTDAGVAHPVPPEAAPTGDVTVVVPVRDRAMVLDRCLQALGHAHQVRVVDDGSVDPDAVAQVVGRHGATLIRRAANGGPGPARNSGLSGVTTEFVAFLDSDCVPPLGWIDQLSAHFADPLVAAVAPRIVAAALPADATRPPRTWTAAFSAASATLDMGAAQARVAPLTRVGYVPTAALLARRSALEAVAAGPDIFDPVLRYGEDVDLIWRLHEAGWRIRYDPRVEIGHHEPQRWRDLLSRRVRYGSSAAPLARRHPEAMAPLVLHPWPALTVAAVLARRPALAAVAFSASVLNVRSRLRARNLPASGVAKAMLKATGQTWLGLGKYCTQFAAPALVLVLIHPGGRTHQRWGRRCAAASLLLAPALRAWRSNGSASDPVRFVIGQLGDDIAYGAGVWASAVKLREWTALRPRVSWHLLRFDRAGE